MLQGNFPFFVSKCKARTFTTASDASGGLKQAENGLKGLVKTQLVLGKCLLDDQLAEILNCKPFESIVVHKVRRSFGVAVRKVASKDMASPATLAIFSFFTAFTETAVG